MAGVILQFSQKSRSTGPLIGIKSRADDDAVMAAKRRANGVVADLFWAISVARSLSPEAGQKFDRCVQGITNYDDGGFAVEISSLRPEGGLRPIVSFCSSLNDGWICHYDDWWQSNRDIRTLVALAHRRISSDAGLALPPIGLLNRLDNMTLALS